MLSLISLVGFSQKKDSPWREIQTVLIPQTVEIHEGVTRSGNNKYWIEVEGIKVSIAPTNVSKFQKGEVKPKKISVAASRISLAAGSTFSLEAQVLPVTANGKLRCTSSDRKVAAVSRGGIIRAKKKGVAKITVKVGTKKKVVSVTVK